MLKLLLGRAGSGKSEELLGQVRDGAAAGRRQLLMVPEQFSHEAERRLCAIGGDGISLMAEVLSFSRLANRVFSVCGGLAVPTLDAGGRLLLMHNAVKAVSQSLTVYRRPSAKPAFLAGLLATLDECKSYRVAPDDLLAAAGEDEGAAGDKLRDLGLIFGAYETLCQSTAADPRDKLTRLAQALAGSGWANGYDVYLDGFTDFTPQEGLVLSELLDQARSVTVALTCDAPEEHEEGAGVFSPARRTVAFLRRLARERGVESAISYPPPRQADEKVPPLRYLEEALFAPNPDPWPQATGAVSIHRASDPWAEVERVAGRVVALARDEGYRYRDMAVAARQFEGYEEIVEAVFRRYDIPLFLTRKSDILEKPILALVTAALDAAANGYLYDDMFRYLKTGLTNISLDEVDLLENYVLKWDIKGSRWTAETDWAMHPAGYGETLKAADAELLAQLNDIRRRVVAPLEGLRRNTDRTGKGQAMALYRFLEEADLFRRLEERAEGLRARGQLGLAEEYGQLWELVVSALEQCALLLGDDPMELEEFAQLFALVLSQYDVGTIPVSLDRVTAGDCTRLGYRSVKVLFLLGCDDGSMPLAVPSPGLLTDDDRLLLEGLGHSVAPRLDQKLARELTIVYTAAATPTQRLFVSWAAAGPSGAEQRPAFLPERLKRLFPAVPVEGPDCGDLLRLNSPAAALELAGTQPAVRRALEALPDWRKRLERVDRALALDRGHLSPRSVEALYGTKVPMSASRLDLYHSCHFSYFMRYGLKAKPRRPAGLQAPEYGTFVHAVLEYVVKHLKDDSTEEDIKALVAAAIEDYADQVLGGLADQTPRFRYLFRRLGTAVEQVAVNVAQELAASRFKPLAFELGFGRKGDLPPVEFSTDGLTVSVTGFVDRVDGWVHDGRLFLRVVDYKTGRKSFDLTDVWNGMGLQMLLYLFTLEREAGELFGGYEIVPAGVLYLPARQATVAGSRSMPEEERRKKIDAELRRKGLLLDDPEVLAAMEAPGEEGFRFLPVRLSARTGTISGDSLVNAERLGKLARHIDTILANVGKELAAGVIHADPYWRGPDHNACRWCEYAAACQFEEGKGGDCRRWLPTVTGAEFWSNLEQGGEGDGLYTD